ncbi:hypothetical protein ACFWZ7_26220 [Nocardiopsis alba]|uniref:hypothetical protein n=1 Tax=Nocardiopsis alba TaxID=53437 RepID=UPI00366C26AA
MADVTELRPSTSPADTDAELTTYAFVMTVQIGVPTGYAIFESSGTWNATPGSSRNEVYKKLRQEVVDNAARAGFSGAPQVIFWSLERDTLL